jgi:hypothetical protein
MADLEDATPVEEEPDLSDLAMVIINVETREGRQLSFLLEPDDGFRLSLDYVLEDYDRLEVKVDEQEEPVRTLPARTIHNFKAQIEEVL